MAGTFKIGNTLYDSNFVFMPLDEAQAFFNTGEGVTGIEVMVTDPDNDMAMLPAIAQRRRARCARWCPGRTSTAPSSRRCRSKAM